MAAAGEEARFAVIIEDDLDIRQLLETVLTQAGFDTIATSNGLDGVQAVRAHSPVVTTLDVNMPGMDGFEAAKRIRRFSSTYLIMLTARDDEIDTLQGLEAGADDYLTKPFRPRELRARIDAMLRRPRQAVADIAPALAVTADLPTEGWHEHNGLRLNAPMRLAVLSGAALELTRTEFDLLAAILESGRRVRSKADLALLTRFESYAMAYDVNEADKRAVEVHMGNLRRKLGDSVSSPRWVETVRGLGYRLAAPDGS